MKKQNLKVFGIAATCAIATVAGGALPTFAESDNYVSLHYHENGQSTRDCYLYRSSGYSDIYKQCDAKYGSYDEATNTLTLKTSINNLPNTSIHFGSSVPITVKSDGNIETAIVSLNETLELDFGSYTFKEKPYQITTSEDNIGGNNFHNLIIKSGKFDLQGIIADELQILGGNIALTPDSYIRVWKNITMSGGSIVSSDSGIFMSAENINISGGEISAENIHTSGISINDGSFVMTGGKVHLKSVAEPAGFGVVNDNDNGGEEKNIVIGGGELTIDGFDWGISGSKNKIFFNGGTTTIKNSHRHTIWISHANDPEHDIVFGDNMGIRENTYVFWDDDEYNPSTGIAESGNVTISEGYTYRRHYGWESINNGPEEGNDDIPSVPDTGFFGMDGKTATVVGLIAALPIFAILGYGIRFAIKRNKQRVKF